MSSDHRRLLERSIGLRGHVDASSGVVSDIKILGANSRNQRRYTHDAMQEAVPRYEGTKVFLNHPTPERLDHDRDFRDWVGVLKGVRFAGGELRGNLHLRRESKHYSEILEAAEHFPESFGMSHVADGDSNWVNGVEIVESITHVFSVDLVMEPATTAGLFESKGAGSLSLAEETDRLLDIAAETRFEIPQTFIDGLQDLTRAIEMVQAKKEWDQEKDLNSALMRSAIENPPPAQVESYFGARRPATFDEKIRRFANGLR